MVSHVVRIGTQRPSQLQRGAVLHLRIGGAPADDGEEAMATERLSSHDRQQRGVDASRIGQQHPPESEQVTTQGFQGRHGQ